MKISVIMGIYNCAETLGEAIDCIINQTYRDWELIMCDDGSSDSTYQVAEEYKNKYPEKIKLIRNEKNMGLNFTLNHCLEYAEGEFIARMDGDDICSSVRFEKQIEFFEKHTDIAIVSSPMKLFDEDGIWGETKVTPYPQKEVLVKKTPFCHAAAMVRKEAYDAVGGYSVDKKLLRVEDYHLWVKMYAEGFKGMNIQEPLYSMRDDRNAIARRKFKYRINEAYVKFLAVKKLKLPVYNYVFCVKPIVLGLVPQFVYKFLHNKKHTKTN